MGERFLRDKFSMWKSSSGESPCGEIFRGRKFRFRSDPEENFPHREGSEK